MDNAQLPVLCLLCQQEILQTDVKAELACHRFLHSRCLIRLSREDGFNHFDECDVCMALLPVTIENEEDDQSVASDHSHHSVNISRRDRIRNLYDTNEAFRNKAKSLIKQKTVLTKSHTQVTKLVTAKKREIRNQLLLIKAQLQGLLEGKKDEVKASPEYKEFIKAERRYTGIQNQFRRNYNCTAYCLGEYLNDKPGFRRFHGISRWRYGHYRMFSRPFYYKVPL